MSRHSKSRYQPSQSPFQRRLKYRILALAAVAPAFVIMFLVVHYKIELDGILRIANLMGTFLHEGGHTVFALLTKGVVTELVVNPDGSGYAMIGGGDPYWYLPAGYMTTTLLPAAMFWVNNRTRWGDLIPTITGMLVFFLTLAFGAKLAGGATTIVVGLVSAAILIYFGIHPTLPLPGGRKLELPDWVWMFVVNLLSLYYGLGGIQSLQYLSQHAAVGNSDDISRFTELYASYFPATTVATLFMLISIVVWIFVIFHAFYGLLNDEEEK